MIQPQHVDKGKLKKSILKANVDTVFCLMQLIAEHNNGLDTEISWTHCILNILQNLGIWANLRPIFEVFYGPSMTHKEDHFAKKCINIGCKIRKFKFGNQYTYYQSSRPNQFKEKNCIKIG